MREIKLTQGKVAMVDDEDFERINQFKWHAHKPTASRTYYAVRNGLPKGKRIFLHREIMQTDKDLTVDHIDHDGLNNQKSNLRNCTHQQNTSNKSAHKNSTSKYVGVSFDKARNKWAAGIKINYKRIALGRYITEEGAAEAYNIAAKKLHGEFANINIL